MRLVTPGGGLASYALLCPFRLREGLAAAWGHEGKYRMQTRSYTALHLVRLPRLDATGAQTLATSLLAAAEEHPTLPEAVRETRNEVAEALKELIDAAVQRLPAPATDGGPSTREVDARLDAAWRGTYNWLTGWARLPDEPKAQIAAELRDRLFPDGLKFTFFSYPRQWAESNTRLSLIDEAELERSFDTLGGRAFLRALRDTHKAYGEVLGITKAQEEEARTTRIRDALDRLADALRAYVLQVSAMERKSDPNSSKVVEQLLRPLMTWESPAPRTKAPTTGETEAPKQEPGSEQGGQGPCHAN